LTIKIPECRIANQNPSGRNKKVQNTLMVYQKTNSTKEK
jgi:hypothetical protein